MLNQLGHDTLPILKILSPVLETALDAVVIVDGNGIVVGWNAIAEETFGWIRSKIVGSSLSNTIIPEEHRKAHHAGMVRYQTTGQKTVIGKRIEITALKKSGRQIPVELSIAPVVDDRGDEFFLGFLRDISGRKREEEQRQLLIDELNHRVKNMIAVVQSIFMQSARTNKSIDGLQEVFLARLYALASAHELLSAGNWQAASFREVLEKTLESTGIDLDRVEITGPDLDVTSVMAVSIAMAIHELATNAIKYGALSNKAGIVVIHWAINDSAGQRHVAFVWEERGGPPVAEPTRKGFGSRLIEKGLASQLGGTASIYYPESGLICKFQARLLS